LVRSKSYPPEVEIARLSRDTEIVREIGRIVTHPIYGSIIALLVLEQLQQHNLIGQFFSTGLEGAIAGGAVINALAPAAEAAAGAVSALAPLLAK
jgi:hypothetical protein